MTKEINITYETLFDFLRREKTREELQKLDPEFFNDVIDYVKEKTKSYDELKDKTDLFAADERLKTEKQLQNVKKIIKEIYERREKKIIALAVDSSRMFSTVIDKSALLEEEKLFFDDLLKVFNKFRKEILFSMLEAKKPEIKETVKDEIKPEEEKLIGLSKVTPTSPPAVESNEEEQKTTQMIRFLYPVPKFVGKSLEEYGPFDKDDVANIPSELAELLVEKGRAELLK